MSLPRQLPSRASRLSRILRAVFDRGLTGWTLRILIGPGAGYGRWIFRRRVFLPIGWTLWIGRNVRGGISWGKRADMYRDRPWSLGVTRHGNAAPWVAH